MDSKRKVTIIGTGGSISTPGRHSLDYEYSDYGPPVEIDELLAMFPEVGHQADITPVRFRTIPGTAITSQDWIELAGLITRLGNANPAPAGIVIAHGTATIEETAYFLNLTVKTAVPVVLVGAQRPPNGLGSDAGVNLVNAVKVAIAPSARGLGVLVVLNEEIQAAREVTKGSTHRLETMRSHDLGMLGYADPDGTVVIYRSPTRRRAPDTEFDVLAMRDLPRVGIAYSHAGADATVIDALAASKVDAIVSAGQAPGKLTPAEDEALARAHRAGMVIVQSSRAGSGRVLERTKLREKGYVAADNLNPQKARILTMLALTISREQAVVQRMFREY